MSMLLDKLSAIKMSSSSNSRAADSALIGVGVMASGILVAQLFTPADPIGKCWRFWKQLGAQVSVTLYYQCDD